MAKYSKISLGLIFANPIYATVMYLISQIESPFNGFIGNVSFADVFRPNFTIILIIQLGIIYFIFRKKLHELARTPYFFPAVIEAISVTAITIFFINGNPTTYLVLGLCTLGQISFAQTNANK